MRLKVGDTVRLRRSSEWVTIDQIAGRSQFIYQRTLPSGIQIPTIAYVSEVNGLLNDSTTEVGS